MNEPHWQQGSEWEQQSPWIDAGDAWSDASGVAQEESVYRIQAETTHTAQSGFGIASLVLSIVAGLLIVLPIIAATVLVAANPNPRPDDPQFIVLGCAMLSGLTVAVLAGVFGLIGVFQPDRGKICAVLGITISAVEILGLAGLLLLGLLAA
jgi:hypothetical protein